jgi:hypothetical protein
MCGANSASTWMSLDLDEARLAVVEDRARSVARHVLGLDHDADDALEIACDLAGQLLDRRCRFSFATIGRVDHVDLGQAAAAARR